MLLAPRPSPKRTHVWNPLPKARCIQLRKHFLLRTRCECPKETLIFILKQAYPQQESRLKKDCRTKVYTQAIHLHIPLRKPLPLPPVPHPSNLRLPHLPLQHEDAIHERLASGRAPRHVNVHRHNPITAPHDRVAVVIISSTVRAAPHANHPPRLRHLIVHLTQRGRHLVGERSGDNHNVRLTRGGTENDAETILIVARGGKVHHFDGAAGETERHGPEGSLTGPIGDLIEGGPGQNFKLATVRPRLGNILISKLGPSREFDRGGRTMHTAPVPWCLPGMRGGNPSEEVG